jgi:hypothetical protein
MEELKKKNGLLPQRIQVDNGSEFISKEFDKWAYKPNNSLYRYAFKYSLHFFLATFCFGQHNFICFLIPPWFPCYHVFLFDQFFVKRNA